MPSWSAPVSPEIAARRAGGRRRINKIRKIEARTRKAAVIKAYHRWKYENEGKRDREIIHQLAQQHGVVPHTIRRYLLEDRRLMQEFLQYWHSQQQESAITPADVEAMMLAESA